MASSVSPRAKVRGPPGKSRKGLPAASQKSAGSTAARPDAAAGVTAHCTLSAPSCTEAPAWLTVKASAPAFSAAVAWASAMENTRAAR